MTRIASSYDVHDDAEHRPPTTEPRTTATPTPSDSELVARVRLGDVAAFEHLFHAYYEPLCAFVLGYVESSMAAEDLVQDMFVRIWERRNEWEVRGKLRSYLYTAARNRALTELRHARIVARTEDAAEHDMTLAGRPPAGSDERVRMDEMAQALARTIEQLPTRRRQAYTLRWQHELSIAEIASLMGVTVKCAEAHLAAASRAIRESLVKFL